MPVRCFERIFAGMLLFFPGIPAAGAGTPVTVEYVIDGDTVLLDSGETVRLIGINAPETANRHKHPPTPAQPFAREAKQALAQLVEKRRVHLIAGRSPKDRYGRTLARLQLPDGLDIQRELLRRGYALAVAIPPNIERLEEYAAAEAGARCAGRGIWGHPYFAVKHLDRDGPPDAPLENGFARITGRVNSVSHAGGGIQLGVGDALSVRIPRRAWREFWPGRHADELAGQRITARGWVSGRAGAKKTMWVRHPFMLKTSMPEC